MKRIDALIEQYCPDGVAFKNLGEIGQLVRGNGLQKSDFTPVGIGCIHYGQIYTHYKAFAYETKSFVSDELAKKLRKVQKNDIVVAATSENIEDVCKSVAWLGEEEIVTGGHSIIIKHKQNPKYLVYFFHSSSFFEQKKKYVKGTKVIEISVNDISKVKIPIPPLTIQQEIVNILDKFTQLEADLKAELEGELKARKVQYDYYRNQLFSYESKNVQTNYLNEIGTFTRGKRFVKTDIISDGFPCIHYGEIYTHYRISAKETKSFVTYSLANRLRKAQPGNIIIVAAGETIGDLGKGVAWLGQSGVIIHDACFAFSHNQEPRYIAHFLQTDLFHDQIRQYVSTGKISSIHSSGLGKAKIPLPSLEEQKKIADTLDKFDLLVNEFSIAIPAEITARKKQYEYYRNKLLTFKELES